MNIGDGLFAWLKSDAAVAGEVDEKIYPVIVPENTALPYIRYQVISDPRPQHLKGYQAARTARLQVDVFAEDYETSRRIAEAIITAVATPGEHGGIRFGRVKAEGPRDLGEETASGFVHRASIDLLAEHKAA